MDQIGDLLKKGYNYYIVGNQLRNQRLYNEALECFDQILQVNPQNLEALIIKSQTLLDLKFYDEAIKCCKAALRIDQKSVLSYVVLSVALCFSHHYHETTIVGQKAEENKIISASVLSNTAYALNNLGRYEEAIQKCDNVLQMDPEMIYAYCNKGYALNNLGRYIEAIECCKKAIEQDTNDALAYSIYGYALFKIEHFDEAISCCEKSLSLAKNNQNAYVTLGYIAVSLGLILLHQHNYQAANEHFLKAIHYNKNNYFFYRLQSKS